MAAVRPSGADATLSGPAVVAIGGGHGLSASLRAARRYAGSVTAVVSVADDGGSSGRLRAMLPDLPAPGDVRRCLGALAAEGEPYADLLEHRFDEGEFAGHALGNLVIVALALELGSFGAAVEEVARRVGAVGRVLPATAEAVGLVAVPLEAAAEVPPGSVGGPSCPPVVGQVAVQNTVGIASVGLQPPAPAAGPGVVEAIEHADQVVVGPGSLFTSVLAAAIVPDVREALARTSARRVFVANLAPQIPETQGFGVADELRVLAEHGVEVDVVVVDPSRPLRRDEGDLPPGVEVLERPVAGAGGHAHDVHQLASALADLASTVS